MLEYMDACTHDISGIDDAVTATAHMAGDLRGLGEILHAVAEQPFAPSMEQLIAIGHSVLIVSRSLGMVSLELRRLAKWEQHEEEMLASSLKGGESR